MSCSRVAMKAMALAFPLTAASMMGGGAEYSAKRSSQLASTFECTRRILPAISPALAKSAECPSPISTTATCLVAVSAGAQATETQRTRNWVGEAGPLESAFPEACTVNSVAPSAQELGILNSSVWTLSAPAALNSAHPNRWRAPWQAFPEHGRQSDRSIG